ncbi:MAG: hypothetical protein KA184_02750 [Candidatus Hydrogenedentes bacterium]|nr:hypothetical protein [Candidatus Hydrogenedentota bacterium]
MTRTRHVPRAHAGPALARCALAALLFGFPLALPAQENTPPDMPPSETSETAAGISGRVAEFGAALLDADPGRAAAARRELETLVFQSGAPETNTDRAALAQSLEQLLDELPAETESAAAWKPETDFFAWLHAIPAAAQNTAARVRLDQARRDIVFWLSLVIEDSDAASLAKWVADPVLAEDAIAALARMRGDTAKRALLDTLVSAQGLTRLSVIRALSSCGATEAVPGLTALARTEQGDVRWCALGVLSALGVPATAVMPLDPAAPPRLAARYAADCLRAALVLAERGDHAQAERLLRGFTDLNARQHQICAALLGLARLGSPALTRSALGFIGTPGVRATAIEVLAADRSPNVEETLVKAYPVTDPSMQAAILRILVRRHSGQAAPLLQQALSAAHAEVRVEAARLQGLMPAEGDLWELAQRGAPWIRHEALRLFLDAAWQRAAAGQKDVAREQFTLVLQGMFPTEARREALNGLERIADPAARPLIERWAKDPDVAEAAACALVAVIGVGDDQAETQAQLLQLAQETPYEPAAAAAVTALAARGVDIIPLLKQRGYLIDWQVLGPFPRDHAAMTAVEAQLAKPGQPPASLSHEGAEFTWRDARASGLPAVVNLESVLGPYQQTAAYAFARVALPQWRPAELHLIFDDMIAMWVNGEKAYESVMSGALDAAPESARVTLQPGWNGILVRVTQENGAWGFGVRLVDRRGDAIGLDAQSMPDDGMSGIGVTADTLRPVIAEDAP